MDVDDVGAPRVRRADKVMGHDLPTVNSGQVVRFEPEALLGAADADQRRWLSLFGYL